MMKKILGVCLVLLLGSAPNLLWAGNLVRISEDARVLVDTEVDELVVINGSADVAGRVMGNVVILHGNINLRNTAYIGGDVICLAGAIAADPGAIVLGSKVEIGGKIGWRSLPYFSIAKMLLWGFVFKVTSSLFLVILCIFLVMMWPNQIRYAAEETYHDLVKACLVGVFAVTLILPLAVGFAITVFGLPIAIALVVFLMVAGWFGVAAISYLVGKEISNRFSPVVAVVVGLVVLKFIHFVPFFGTFLYYIALLPGLGAILLTRFGTNKPWLGSSRARLAKMQ